jgi:UDP-N-acetylglucosamine acyltransferase
VVVGPFCVVGEHVEIGEGCILEPHAVLDGWTTLGKSCYVGIGVVLGAPPQDKKYAGARSYVRIGNGNTFREYVTVHRSTSPDGETVIGDDNYIMAMAHIAHDCRIGSDVTITNYAGVSGHVVVEDHAYLGGLSAFHQFVRIGAYAIVGGNCGARMDVVPFAMATGEPLRIYGLNRLGLRRCGFTMEQQKVIKGAFRILFWSGLNTSEALARLRAELGGNEHVQRLIRFVEGSKRGLTRGVEVEAGGSAGEAEL